jgi:hypothetical protein
MQKFILGLAVLLTFSGVAFADPNPAFPGRHGHWDRGHWERDGHRDLVQDLRDQLTDLVQDGQAAQASADGSLSSAPDYFTQQGGVDAYLAIYSFTAQAQATLNVANADWSKREAKADVAHAIDNLENAIRTIRENNKFNVNTQNLDSDLQDVRAITNAVLEGWRHPGPGDRDEHRDRAKITVSLDKFIEVAITHEGVFQLDSDHDPRRTRLDSGTLELLPQERHEAFRGIRNVRVISLSGDRIRASARVIGRDDRDGRFRGHEGERILVRFEDPQSGGSTGSFIVSWDSN